MKWLIRISNSHINISTKEIANLIGHNYIEWKNKLICIVEASEELMQGIVDKSASIKYVIQNPKIVTIDTDIIETIEQINYSKLDHAPEDDNLTFAARFYQVLNKDLTLTSMQVEAEIGKHILNQYPQLQVNLDYPDLEYACVAWGNELALGWMYKKIPYAIFASREPKNTPYFGGGSMKPVLCRILVNLLQPLDPVVLDPFSGLGGILREIADLGSYAIGLEISYKTCYQSRLNNAFHEFDELIDVVNADSLNSPFRKGSFSMAVTDPPYAIQTTTKGRERSELIQDWLELQQKQMQFVMTIPSKMEIKIPNDWKVLFSAEDYVHRSLTRKARKMVKLK